MNTATDSGLHETPTGLRPSPAFLKARRQRNWAIALSLIGFAVLLFVITLVKLGPGAVARPF